MTSARPLTSRRPRRTRIAIALLATLGLFAAACGGSDNNANGGSGGGNGSDTTTGAGGDGGTTGGNTGADPGDNDPDAELVFIYAQPNRTMDPALSPWAFDLIYMRPVYDTLMRLAEDGSIEPGLATEWAFEDDTLVIQLREGVVFHDGTDFDAEAVRANIERMQNIDGGTQKTLLASVTSVEVIDTHTVHLHTNGAAGALVPALTGYPGMMVSPAAFDSADLALEAVGTGPYTLVENDPGVELVYERFADAWEPDEAAVATLRILRQADAGQRVNQLKTGQGQATMTDPNLVADAEAEGMQVVAKIGTNFWGVTFNTDRALADIDARRAINLAIDREALVDGLDFGFGSVSSQLIPEGTPGYNADIQPTFDPELARKLAESSGLSGQTLVFLGSATPTITGYQEAIQGMLAEAGINVEIRSVEQAQSVEELAAGNWDIYMTFYPGSADGWLTYNAMFGAESPQFPGTAPSEVTDLMDQALIETDPAIRTELFENLAVVVDDHQLIAILAHPRRPTIALPQVTNFHGNVHGIPELRGTGIANS